jgi:hypothetical protein
LPQSGTGPCVEMPAFAGMTRIFGGCMGHGQRLNPWRRGIKFFCFFLFTKRSASFRLPS